LRRIGLHFIARFREARPSQVPAESAVPSVKFAPLDEEVIAMDEAHIPPDGENPTAIATGSVGQATRQAD
jgi:hypothetical protein